MSENGIDVRQNSPEGLRYLCAYSSVYSKAKLVLGIQTILTIPVALGWSIALIFCPDLKPYMIVTSFSVTLLDSLLLDRMQSRLKEEAARIQEMFDCFLFEIPWRTLQVGKTVGLERLIEEESNYRKRHTNIDHLRDWFASNLNTIPLVFARLICQRTNLQWDKKLRSRYVTTLIVLLILCALVVFLISIERDLSVPMFFSTVLAVLSPVFIWGIREVTRHRESIRKLKELKDYVEIAWRDALEKELTPEQLEDKSSEIQTELYRLRSHNPLIFNWIYKLQRDRTQRHVDEVAKDLIAELRNANLIG